MLMPLLQQMEKQSSFGLKEKGDARSLWINEWSRLFLKAFEPESTVVYSSLYAFPGELLAAYDVIPFDFELASGLLGVAGMQMPPILSAESKGYPIDLCSFHRASIGAFLDGYFPKPDLLITTSYFCDSKVKTNEALSLFSNKKSMLLYVPAEINRDSIRYVEKQLRDISQAIADASGQKFDEDRLKEAVRSSNRARKTQLEFLELLKQSPAPWGGQGLISYSINGLVFSGTEIKELLDREFLNEAKHRVEAGEYCPEKHRIYWFAWLPAYRSNLFEILARGGVSIPLCETYNVYWDEIDENKPFEGLAMKCLRNPFIGQTSRRIQGLDEIVDDYRIDGGLLFATPACRHSKTAARLIHDAFTELNKPFLVLDMDISDPRGYSPEQIQTRIESFIELLENR